MTTNTASFDFPTRAQLMSADGPEARVNESADLQEALTRLHSLIEQAASQERHSVEVRLDGVAYLENRADAALHRLDADQLHVIARFLETKGYGIELAFERNSDAMVPEAITITF